MFQNTLLLNFFLLFFCHLFLHLNKDNKRRHTPHLPEVFHILLNSSSAAAVGHPKMLKQNDFFLRVVVIIHSSDVVFTHLFCIISPNDQNKKYSLLLFVQTPLTPFFTVAMIFTHKHKTHKKELINKRYFLLSVTSEKLFMSCI